MADVRVRSLTKVFPGGVRAIDELDLDIEDGEFFALLGPSGCGKTTLLRTLAGLETATSGRLEIGGREVTRLPPGARDVAMVFQDYALYPHMRVDDNIAYPLKIKKVSKTERRARAAEVGSHLGLEPLLLRRPAQLSGGQQQRVALARAMAFRPQLFLLDEPLSNLDARLRLEARTFLRRLQTEVATTTVYVTHDQAEALALADRIAVMEAGKIRQLGTPVEVFKRPANLFVAGFIGSLRMNLLPATVSGERLALGESSVPVPPSAAGQVREGEEVILGARPEFCTLVADGEDAIAGEVTILENLGTEYLVTVEAGETVVQVTVDEGDEPAAGERVRVRPVPERALVYRADDGNLVGSPATEPAPVEA
ncbi:MAG TPA: ABC transporter ATP-binding protein [Gaiellaceae bacterium]|jgi:multiple sugar transport system ATP-binding protein|nr:ABC transporter ATP-binding protein [Gaiellaceae bacterium]